MAKKFLIRRKKAGVVTATTSTTTTGDWLYAHKGTVRGPITLEQLKNAAASNELQPADEVWRVDTPIRVWAGCLPWLFSRGGGYQDAGPGVTDEPLTCPHCGATFQPEEMLFVAYSKELPHDLLLGPGRAYRFRPVRFTIEGAAIDPSGVTTPDHACPACHAALSPTPADEPEMPAMRGMGRSHAKDKDVPERLPPQLATIDGVRHLVGDIRGILARSASARLLGDVVARQYAELCRRANLRLALCQHFIQNHQLIEACDQALQPPALVELCEALPFPDMDQWRQICARSRWAVSESIDLATLEQVRACMHGAAPFEPALRAFRRAVLRGRPAEVRQMLYTLMMMDVDNLNWRMDAAAFEDVRQTELFEIAIPAIEAGDLDALRPVAAELSGPWVSPPEPEMLAIVQAECAKREAMVVTQKGQEILQHFVTACDAQDFDAAAEAESAYQALLAAGGFDPTDEMRQTYASGRIWFSTAQAQREADAAFGRDLASLESALAQPQPGEDVDHFLHVLETTGRDLPAELVERAHRAIRRRKSRGRRQARLRMAIHVVSIVVPLLLVGLGLWYFALTKQRVAWTAKLALALKADDLSAYDDAMNAMTRSYGPIFGRALLHAESIEDMRAQRADLVARCALWTHNYTNTLAALQTIQEQGFVAPADQVLKLLAQGKTLAKTIPQMAEFEKIETPWRADQAAKLAEALTRLPAAGPVDVFTQQPFATATQEVARYCSQVGAADALKGADKETRDKLVPFLSQAAICKSNLSARLAVLAPAAKARRLESYLDVLIRYSGCFPNDTLCPGFADAMSSRNNYRDVMNVASNTRERTMAIISGDAWKQVHKSFDAFYESKTLNQLRWAVRKDNNEVVLVLGHEAPETGFHGEWAEVYEPQTGDTAPAFKRARVTDDPPYKMGLADHPSQPWHHTALVQTMLENIRASKDANTGARTVELQFRSLATEPVWDGSGTPGTNELPNVAFKVQLLVFLAEQMTHLSPYAEWQQILDELRQVDVPQTSWVCLKCGDVRLINHGAPKALEHIFGAGGLIHRLDVHRAATVVANRTPMVWAGYVDFSSAETINWMVPTPPADVIVLRPGPGVGHAMVAVNAGVPGQLRLPLVPGEPVLAWSDGAPIAHKTAALVALLGGSVDMTTAVAILPSWWPRDSLPKK